MSFGNVFISGDVIWRCFTLCCKVDKHRRYALCSNNERTWAWYIIKCKPSENCQSVDLWSMPEGAPRVIRQLVPYRGWFRDNGFRLKIFCQTLKNSVIVKSDVKNNSHFGRYTSFFWLFFDADSEPPLTKFWLQPWIISKNNVFECNVVYYQCLRGNECKASTVCFKIRQRWLPSWLVLLAFITHWYNIPSKHILLCIQFRSLHTYNISAPAFTISRTRQTFEASGKLVLPEDILTLLLANPMPKLEDGFLIKHWIHLMAWKADRLMCCFKASNIGGIFSMVLSPKQTEFFLQNWLHMCW